tara:strand:+ start:23 stop:454 length:432 start_codon:yes stop_codon:yes gene_type:complete
MVHTKIIKQFRDILKKEGLKVTPQRLAVLKEVSSDNSHRESEEIYMAMKKKKWNVSRATIYRTLDILVENNFVRKLNLGDGRARYESKTSKDHHDHLICESCNKIIEFVDQEIEDIQDEIAKDHKFILNRHIHQLFGICFECQ